MHEVLILTFTYPLPRTLKQHPDEVHTVPISPNLSFGEGSPILIAGPCTLESYEHTVSSALTVKEAGAQVFRGSIRKPRTSPFSFQGWEKECVLWHKEAQSIHGLPTETEVLDVRDVEITAEHVDILRIGAKNMHNTPLLQEVSKSHRPIILKRSPAATLEEWLCAAEYILASSPSCPGVILCERGIRTFEHSTRYTLDLNTVALLKEISSLPVIVDPSHAAGKRSLVLPLASAGLSVGADGLMIEVHAHPEKALCDAKQQITPEELHLFAKKHFCPSESRAHAIS
ncbi:2-dehydro-3-deoxyphosphoheptonate aldolase [Chlamydia pneumoniae TW-183]|uniref:Deoxyheptonate Aldolase n=2 Tax=Chlamydia pneumoniae TaxID=83558 RepID=Q9Z867_CHLPN|nr:3-deoxy-7-phosphoheptulonate synthase [Chlamydia pneumoniae]AAD18624.1 Deoxyheptonate Aldolase [Chlamydia pneumoniae CWL029]AAF38130.1 phospho-2-dehydro-3-deoxyheptonate aldolase, putative [Chlamydia pneumoniae AR39]AAP98433.1 2-dehydro-3-deoxyphosphoheptonate aldolase [Chlamydia pneumoniae TW-183]CRI32995.1 Phospho-2-dehydro-3-deoxyheptonate aldolase [Chlamydia pneumoniae]CRI35858.1 Phospho-2-dehydro-3-deoxyheptonate aldolase [Chlamydia pneumoniae]